MASPVAATRVNVKVRRGKKLEKEEANLGCDHVCVEINQGSSHFKLSRSQTELSQDLGRSSRGRGRRNKKEEEKSEIFKLAGGNFFFSFNDSTQHRLRAFRFICWTVGEFLKGKVL